MHTTLALAGLALVAAGLPLAAPAQAEVETCQGKPATIVNENGTEGDDVIVVNRAGAIAIYGLGGDDLMCITRPEPTEPRGNHASVWGGPGDDSLVLRGSDEADVTDVGQFEDMDIDMGGGFDDLQLFDSRGAGVIDGGPGAGKLRVRGGSGSRVFVNLSDHLLRTRSGGGVGEYGVKRFRDVYAMASHVTVVGDAKSNLIVVDGCRFIKGSGGRGDDRLFASHWDTALCRHPRVRLDGLGGDDMLNGSRADDVLVGGQGRDVARGRKGSDRCVAEQRSGCETLTRTLRSRP